MNFALEAGNTVHRILGVGSVLNMLVFVAADVANTWYKPFIIVLPVHINELICSDIWYCKYGYITLCVDGHWQTAHTDSVTISRLVLQENNYLD